MLTRQHGAELLVVHVLELTEDALAARVKRFSPLPANARLIEIARRELCSDLRDAGDSVTIDVLLAAFGSCTSMTVALYARRKQWQLESVRVRLRHSKVHADDCAECETRLGMMDQVEREIELEGTLDEEQRARLLDIANECPVHRTLASKIQTRLVGPGQRS
jgi:uncharacterized OsmC-like protein